MPKRKPSHIHINGRHYDADTGEPLDGQPAPAPTPTPVIAHHHAKPAHHAVHPVHPPAKTRPPVNHTHPHPRTPAKTLMRHAVHKPGRPHHLHAQGHIARATLTVTPKSSVRRLDERRSRHARHINRSQLISHFSAGATYPVPVIQRPHPEPLPKPPHQATPAHHVRKRILHHRKPATTADLLQKALEQAASFRELPVK